MRVFFLGITVLLGACAVEAGSEVPADLDPAVLSEDVPLPTKSLSTYFSVAKGEKQGTFKGGCIAQGSGGWTEPAPSTSTTATTSPK
jgi:hypothetical protein